MHLKTLAAIAAFCLPLLPASAQESVYPGFLKSGSLANPVPWSTYVTLGDGSRVHFDGIAVTHYSASGTYLNTLHSFPAFSYVGAIAADPAGDSVLVGESTIGDVFRVELDGSGATFLVNLPFNYSAAYEAPGVAVVSASVCGWACGNDLVRVDTHSGATVTIAHVSGPSGPVAFGDSGDLYYGSSVDDFPAPPGAGAIWRFDAAAVGSGALLGDGDATVLCSGIDMASSIAVDPLLGDLVVTTNLTDASFNVIADSVLLIRPDGELKYFVASGAGEYRSHAELRLSGGPGHFRAHQPHGVTLTSQWGDAIHSIDPARPTATVVSNGGNSYLLQITGAEPDGAMLVTYGDSAFHQGSETSYQLSFDFLFHTGLPINRIRRVGQFYMPCDASGSASFPFWDGGNLAGTLVFQGVITDSQGGFVGSTESAFH